MLFNVIAVLLGLVIFDGVGCLPILNSIDSENTNTIRPPDDAPADASSIFSNYLMGILSPLFTDGLDDLPIIEREYRNNGRGNPSPPATLDDDEDTIIGKRNTPSLIGGVIIGAREEMTASQEVEEAAKGEPEGHNEAKNTSPPATLEERDPDIIGDLSSLIVTPLQVFDIITRRSEVDGLSVSSTDDPSPPAILTVSSSATKERVGYKG
ncbi:hypothetical protein EAF04_006090 [Stromatinia cepivora]|nr:hypothetical protein EAF04_006090 [Stromatinia cepivora]